MDMNLQNPIQNEQDLEMLRRYQIQQRVELKRNMMGMNLQIPIQDLAIGAWQKNIIENAHEQFPFQKPLLGVQNSIQGFEMGVW